MIQTASIYAFEQVSGIVDSGLHCLIDGIQDSFCIPSVFLACSRCIFSQQVLILISHRISPHILCQNVHSHQSPATRSPFKPDFILQHLAADPKVPLPVAKHYCGCEGSWGRYLRPKMCSTKGELGCETYLGVCWSRSCIFRRHSVLHVCQPLQKNVSWC